MKTKIALKHVVVVINFYFTHLYSNNSKHEMEKEQKLFQWENLYFSLLFDAQEV